MAQYEAQQFAQEIINIVKNTPKEELEKLTTNDIIQQAQKNIETKSPLVLEVTVNDTTKVIDKLMDAITYIIKLIQEWMFSKAQEPLVISIKKIEARGPPIQSNVLSVSVGDKSNIKTGLV